MPKEIEVNGQIIEFPSDMPDSEIEAVLQREFGAPTPPPPQTPSRLRGMREGEGLPPSGVLGALGGVGETALSSATGYLANIPAGFAGMGYGVVPGGKTGAEAVESVKEALTYQPRLDEGQAIAEGLGKTIQPVAQSFTDALETPYPLLSAALKTGVQGAAEILPAAAATRGVSSVAPKPGTFVPQIKDLYAAGRVAFNEARLNGGGIKPETLNRLRRGVSDFRNEAGVRVDFDPDLHPQAVRVQNRIQESIDSGAVNFDELLTLRELAGDVAGNADAAISFRGVLPKNEIDDFVDSLKPGDVLSGDPGKAARSLETARNLWRDASKARTIEREIELAGNRAGQFSGSGYENALRTQFRQLNARIIKGQERGFTKAEIEAIQRVANGGGLDNVYRALGKFAPTGVVSTGIGTGLGYATLGPLGAAGVPAAGGLGRWLATKGTIGNAQKAMELPLMRSLIDEP